MWGLLNPRLGWTWKDEQGNARFYYLHSLYVNAGMLTGIIRHTGVLATRPIADFALMSLDGHEWRPAKDLISLVPKEMGHALQKTTVPVQIQYRLGMEEVL